MSSLAIERWSTERRPNPLPSPPTAPPSCFSPARRFHTCELLQRLKQTVTVRAADPTSEVVRASYHAPDLTYNGKATSSYFRPCGSALFNSRLTVTKTLTNERLHPGRCWLLADFVLRSKEQNPFGLFPFGLLALSIFPNLQHVSVENGNCLFLHGFAKKL